MKTIGLLGGMSYESTLEYYRMINKKINNKLGKLHSGKILLYSFDFKEIESLQSNNNWNELGIILGEKSKQLSDFGADYIAICTNTMHKLVDQISIFTDTPILHISDAVGQSINNSKLKNIFLLGTKFTMKQDFYKKILIEKYNLNITIPNEEEMNNIHSIIYNELCLGIVSSDSKKKFIDIINSYNIEGVILGCTEIQMLISQKDFSNSLNNIKIFDSTEIHCDYIVSKMLEY